MSKDNVSKEKAENKAAIKQVLQGQKDRIKNEAVKLSQSYQARENSKK